MFLIRQPRPWRPFAPSLRRVAMVASSVAATSGSRSSTVEFRPARPDLQTFGRGFRGLAVSKAAPPDGGRIERIGPRRMMPTISPAIPRRSRPVGPTVSSVNDSGSALARLTRPQVGLKPVTPQKCAGKPDRARRCRNQSAGRHQACGKPRSPRPDDEPPVIRVGFPGNCGARGRDRNCGRSGYRRTPTCAARRAENDPAASSRATAVDVAGSDPAFRAPSNRSRPSLPLK